MNYDQLIPTKFGENTIKKVSKIQSRQFNSIQPTFTNARISIDQIEDESAFLNVGQYKETNYL